MKSKQTSYFKVGLVVILGVVFVGAMANSMLTIYGTTSPPPPPRRAAHANAHVQPAASKPTAAPATTVARQVTSVVESTLQTPSAESNKVTWPMFSLDEIIAHDPFTIAKVGDVAGLSKSTTPSSGDAKTAAQAVTDDAKSASNEPDPHFAGRIHAVYQRGGKTAALIGSKTIRPGDNIEGGKVVEVDQGGLMLELSK